MAERFVDFAAVNRISRRIELKSIHMADVWAKCDPRVQGALEPELEVDCNTVSREIPTLEISCDYRFSARVGEMLVAEAKIKYLLFYDVQGSEPLIDEDLAEFTVANGTLHSWPFMREFLHGLTARMGFPPYTIPVFHFKPKPREKKEVPIPAQPGGIAESPKPESTG